MIIHGHLSEQTRDFISLRNKPGEERLSHTVALTTGGNDQSVL